MQQYYYQFSDSLASSLKALNIRTAQMQTPGEIVEVGLGHEDTVLLLANLDPYHVGTVRDVLLQRRVNTILYETEPQHDPEATRYASFNPVAVWTYK